MKAAWDDWDELPERKAALKSLLADIVQLWASGGDPDAADEDAELRARLEGVLAWSKVARFLQAPFKTWAVTLYIAALFSAAIASVPSLQQFLWLSSALGKTGKSTVVKLPSVVLGGDTPNSYCDVMNFETNFLGCGQGRQGNAPEVAQCAGKRFIVVEEGKQKQSVVASNTGELNAELIKKLSGGCSSMKATAKYQDPRTFTPSCLLVFLQNGTPPFPDGDEAFFSRMVHLRMPRHFTESTEEANEDELLINHRAADEAYIRTMVPEMLHWVAAFAPYLFQLSNARRLEPRPAKVREDTDDYMASPVDAGAEPAGRVFWATMLRVYQVDEAEMPASRAQIQEPGRVFRELHNRITRITA